MARSITWGGEERAESRQELGMARLPPRKGWSQGTETTSMASGAGGPLHCSLCFCVFETFPQNNVLGKSSEQHPKNKNKKNGNLKKKRVHPIPQTGVAESQQNQKSPFCQPRTVTGSGWNVPGP